MSRLIDILKVTNLSYSYGFSFSLEDINFSLKKGSILAVLGSNGSGKSTLLKIIAGIIKKDSGVDLFSKPIREYESKKLASIVTYLPQQIVDGKDITVIDYIKMGRYIYMDRFLPPSSDDLQAIDMAMGMTSTKHFSDRIIGSLSEGEKARVLIAAAISQSCELMLFDEPTAHLDPKSKSEIMALIKRLNSEDGKSMVIVTHDLNLAALVSDQILALKEGRVVYSGSSSSFIEKSNLKKLYDRDFTIAAHPVTGKKMVFPDIY